MSDPLPASRGPSALAPLTRSHLVPVVIATVGDQAAWHFIDFFTANIRNPHKRLVTGQIMPANPAAAVRGPKHVVKTGPPVWRKPKQGGDEKRVFRPDGRPTFIPKPRTVVANCPTLATCVLTSDPSWPDLVTGAGYLAAR